MQSGMKVVCVDDNFPSDIGLYYDHLPVKDTTYIVRDVTLGCNWKREPGEVAITLVGLINPCSSKPPYPERSFNAERFRPVQYRSELEESRVSQEIEA